MNTCTLAHVINLGKYSQTPSRILGEHRTCQPRTVAFLWHRGLTDLTERENHTQPATQIRSVNSHKSSTWESGLLNKLLGNVVLE